MMASREAVNLFEQIYAKVDKQVRAIIAAEMPDVTVAAQDDGTVIANDHRIVNFQGDGVLVSDEPTMRRVNVFIPGAPVDTGGTVVVSSTSAKARSLWVAGTGTARWFRGTLTWTGPQSVDWNFFWMNQTPWTGGGGSTVITSPPRQSSGTTVTYGPWQLADTSTWIAIGGEGRTANQQNYAVTWTQTFEWATSSTGPWTQLCTVTVNETTTANGWTTVENCDVRPVFTGGSGSGNGAPPSGWETPAYNDTSWSSAVAAGSTTGIDSGLSGSTAIWSASSAASSTEQTLTRQTFTLPAGTIRTATLLLQCDDDCPLGAYINGTLVPGSIETTTGTGAAQSFSLPTAQLTAGGSNLIAVGGANGHSALNAWIAYKITVSYLNAGTDSRYQLVSEKNQANGYAGLDSGTRVPTARLGSGTASSSTFLRGDQTWAAGGGGAGTSDEYAVVLDQKTQNTQGGTFTQGAWQRRDLNTIQANTGGWLSVSGNQITLTAATYRARIRAPAYYCYGHQARLQNITAGTTLLLGQNENNNAQNNGDSSTAEVVGVFTLSATSVLEVQHRCLQTRATNGLGLANNWGAEIYTVAEFWKQR